MSEDMNTKYVNKYIQVLKARHDGMLNDMINLEARYNLIKESLDERENLVSQLQNKIEELEQKEIKKSTRSTTSKETTKEETF
jgi:hypothetical protein